jgi:hypothetical protein
MEELRDMGLTPKIAKLTKKDFFDVYGISLILKETRCSKTVQYLIFILESVVQKYIDVSYYAIRAELRYFRHGAHRVNVSGVNEDNVDLLKKLGIKNWRTQRTKLSLKDAKFLFEMGDWDDQYGGGQWANICRAVARLEALLPITEQNVQKVISAIDYLNDLEHNNALYIDQYSTFFLVDALDNKAECSESEILAQCSPEVRTIYCEV